MYKEFMMQALFRSEKQGKRTSIALLLVLTILFTLIPGAAIAAPQESSAQSAAAHSGWFYYTVQPGDTLYGIARYYGVSAQAILERDLQSQPHLCWTTFADPRCAGTRSGTSTCTGLCCLSHCAIWTGIGLDRQLLRGQHVHPGTSQ